MRTSTPSRSRCQAANRMRTLIAMEAENFTVAPKSSWVAGDWGHAPTRYAATIANTFMSRRSCLHAPANVSDESSATMAFSVQKAGSYSVLLRYEAAYLFETPFHVEILNAQKSAVFTKTYGLRQSLKVQGFGKARLQKAAGAGPTGPYTQGSMCGAGRGLAWPRLASWLLLPQYYIFFSLKYSYVSNYQIRY